MSTTEKIQLAFKHVTGASNSLRQEVQQINIINAPLSGYKIAQGFGGIISSIAQYTVQIQGGGGSQAPTTLLDKDAKLVVQSLTTFVQVHQALLNVVIGKHGIITLAAVTLVSLEKTVDAFAAVVIAESPTQEPAADQQFGSLSVKLQEAISTYAQPLPKAAVAAMALEAPAVPAQ